MSINVPFNYHLVDEPFAFVDQAYDMSPYVESLSSDANYHLSTSDEGATAMLLAATKVRDATAPEDTLTPDQVWSNLLTTLGLSEDVFETVEEVAVANAESFDKSIPSGTPDVERPRVRENIPGCVTCFHAKGRPMCIGYPGKACVMCKILHRGCEVRGEFLRGFWFGVFSGVSANPRTWVCSAYGSVHPGYAA